MWFQECSEEVQQFFFYCCSLVDPQVSWPVTHGRLTHDALQLCSEVSRGVQETTIPRHLRQCCPLGIQGALLNLFLPSWCTKLVIGCHRLQLKAKCCKSSSHDVSSESARFFGCSVSCSNQWNRVFHQIMVRFTSHIDHIIDFFNFFCFQGRVHCVTDLLVHVPSDFWKAQGLDRWAVT